MIIPRAWRLSVAVLLAFASAAYANGPHGTRRPDEPPTAFERFVVDACSPCAKEVYRIGALPAPSLRITAFGRGATGPTTRPGEIGIEVLRASVLGRQSRQRLALGVTLMVMTGTAAEMYRLGRGLLDEEEVSVLIDAIGDMGRAMAGAPATGDDSLDIEFHGGSLRVGVVRLRGETVGYVQTGDVSAMSLRPVWEVPTTMFVAAGQLPALANVIGQAAARIQKLRAGP
jgi:hypothetical protein